MNGEVLALASQLHREHRPYVLATVVWSRAPSSGKGGSTALIEADGTVHGWIGGACAEPVVIRESRRAINDGTPRLLYLGPADELDGYTREGVTAVPISCASEGALEVFMEPVLPVPHIVVIGRSPAVRTLARLGLGLDWRVTVVDDDGDAGEMPQGAEVIASLADFDAATSGATAVIVATQGHYDEPALEKALESGATYVGMVASRRRSQSVLGYLADQGVPAGELARVRTPAGLDLGHIEHREIAVAILAELVQLKSSHQLTATRPSSTTATPPAPAVDPVCGMTVDVAGARFTTEHDGETVYFCCPACKALFERSPADYVVA